MYGAEYWRGLERRSCRNRVVKTEQIYRIRCEWVKYGHAEYVRRGALVCARFVL